MEQGSVWVLLSYDLAEEPNCHGKFKELMEADGWGFKAEGIAFPETTCIRPSEQSKEEDAHKEALNDLKQIADEIRKDPACRDFLVTKYFLVAHRVGPSVGSVGEDL